jgi:protocatechuate 3,4-dioxygenase beta subunit
MMMKSIFAVLLSFVFFGVPLAKKCRCPPPKSDESTHWVGNLQMVFVDRRAYRQLRGIVRDPNGNPVKDALLEVLTGPEYLLIDKPIDKRGRSSQRRVAACRTGADGRFCFGGLPAGRYELRSSSDDTATGWNVSQVYVVVSPRGYRKKELIVEMTLGI